MKLSRFSPRRTTALATAILALPLLAPVGAQNTATTDPVGYITLNVTGTTGGSQRKISFSGLGLTRPVVYQGSAETASGTQLVDNEANFTALNLTGAGNAHYVEIVAEGQGDGLGTTYDIASASGTTITLAQPLASNVSGPVTIRIRPHWTLNSIFGSNNEAGLVESAGVVDADQVQIWTGSGYKIAYFQNATAPLGGRGFRSTDDSYLDIGNDPIYPEDGLIFKRIGNGDLKVVLLGAVKLGASSIPVQSGINIFSNQYATDMTLDSSQLYKSDGTGLVGGDGSSNADQVLLWNGSGYDIYIYQIAAPALGGTGWRSLNDTYEPAGATKIPLGSAFVVKRLLGGAFDWKAPQHPAVIP